MSAESPAAPGKYRCFIRITLGGAAVSLHFSALARELTARAGRCATSAAQPDCVSHCPAAARPAED